MRHSQSPGHDFMTSTDSRLERASLFRKLGLGFAVACAMVCIPAASEALSGSVEEGIAFAAELEENARDLEAIRTELSNKLSEKEIEEIRTSMFEGRSEAQLRADLGKFAENAEYGHYATVPEEYKRIVRSKLGRDRLISLKERVSKMKLTKQEILDIVEPEFFEKAQANED